MAYDYNSSNAGTVISKIFETAESQKNNARNFSNALSELHNYFSVAVSDKFMAQAQQHSTDLFNNASNISQAGSGLSAIKAKSDQMAAQLSRQGGLN